MLKFNFSEIFEFSSEMYWILKELWTNSDVKSSNGSIPRRPNLSTQAILPRMDAEQKEKAVQAFEKLAADDTPMVRRAAAQYFSGVVEAAPPALRTRLLLW